MQLVPAIDLRGGQCVRLLQGRFDAETVYGDDPGVILGRYRDLGARYVHVVDLDGARDGSQGNRAAIARLARAFADTAIQVGGGVRSRKVAAELLGLGVQRIVIGSVAVTNPPRSGSGWRSSAPIASCWRSTFVSTQAARRASRRTGGNHRPRPACGTRS